MNIDTFLSTHNFIDVFPVGYDYDNWFMKTNDKDLIEILSMMSLESDNEVKEVKGLKILTPNKLLTRLPVLLAEIKAANNLCTN